MFARVIAAAARVPAVGWWLLLAIWAAGIFIGSNQPNLHFLPDASADYVLRKAGHFVVFAVLALLTWLALQTSGVGHAGRWAFVAACCYAVSDEFHQAFVAGRYPFVGDVLIDAAGAALALIVVARFVRGSGLGGALGAGSTRAGE